EAGQVHGLGASDMKGSLAVMLALAGELAGLPLTLSPLFVVFGREEVGIEESVLEGLFGACPAIGEARLAVVMEPTANRLQAGCLGSISAALEFRGVAAHSARPWLGVNAIHEAVRGLRPVAEAAAHGVDAVNFGPGDPALAHRRDERVGADALAASLATLRRFLCG